MTPMKKRLQTQILNLIKVIRDFEARSPRNLKERRLLELGLAVKKRLLSETQKKLETADRPSNREAE